MLSKLKVKNFDLDSSLCCGQAFRWKKAKNGYWYGVVSGQVIKIKQEDDSLLFRTSPFKQNIYLLNKYFNLDLSYPRMVRSINKDEHIARAIKKYSGLRILHQEPFECLISYIVSINKNIPAISMLINNLCKRYGKKIEFEGRIFHTFPTIDALKKLNLRDFKALRVGFRARYLKDAVAKISSRKVDLDSLEKLEYREAREKLMEIIGVGGKVADCVLLFAFNKYEAFPIDLWIGRAMRKYYFRNKNVTDKIIREFAQNHFGKYPGYAQEFLYHYFRCLHK
ncbi:MAG: DNA-3-methyladenine glycosylase 2 family protein [Candidatus Saganbacteria bacterium]|nr:DNA-3-methyladenine glycosylase 2 family protein [Candidatus Saganbacteria bacterium]